MIKTILPTLAFATLLTACGAKGYDDIAKIEKDPVLLPYSFQVESFLDRRPGQGKQTLTEVLNPRETYPFKQNLFLQSLLNNINGSSFYEYEPATLRVELKDYAGFKDGLDYTTSFYVDITGFDANGRVLATGVFSCFAEENISSRAFSGIASFLSKHDQNADNEDKKISDAWGELYASCLNDVAYEFNAKVMQWQQRRG